MSPNMRLDDAHITHCTWRPREVEFTEVDVSNGNHFPATGATNLASGATKRTRLVVTGDLAPK